MSDNQKFSHDTEIPSLKVGGKSGKIWPKLLGFIITYVVLSGIITTIAANLLIRSIYIGLNPISNFSAGGGLYAWVSVAWGLIVLLVAVIAIPLLIAVQWIKPIQISDKSKTNVSIIIFAIYPLWAFGHPGNPSGFVSSFISGAVMAVPAYFALGWSQKGHSHKQSVFINTTNSIYSLLKTAFGNKWVQFSIACLIPVVGLVFFVKPDFSTVTISKEIFESTENGGVHEVVITADIKSLFPVKTSLYELQDPFDPTKPKNSAKSRKPGEHTQSKFYISGLVKNSEGLYITSFNIRQDQPDVRYFQVAASYPWNIFESFNGKDLRVAILDRQEQLPPETETRNDSSQTDANTNGLVDNDEREFTFTNPYDWKSREIIKRLAILDSTMYSRLLTEEEKIRVRTETDMLSRCLRLNFQKLPFDAQARISQGNHISASYSTSPAVSYEKHLLWQENYIYLNLTAEQEENPCPEGLKP